MRTSGWMKRQPWFWPAKLFFKRLSGRELWLKPDLSVSTLESGGWNYIASKLNEDSIVYSLGVGDSIDFDLEVINRTGATVHAFDPTPYAKEWVQEQSLPQQFIFHPWAASGENGSLRLFRRINTRGKRAQVMWTADSRAGDAADFIDAPAHTISSIMQKLNHQRIQLLKVDVEGAEYDILETLRSVEHPPEQLLIEYHHRFPGIGKQRTASNIAMLRELGYKIFDVSETGREIGFVLSQAGSGY